MATPKKSSTKAAAAGSKTTAGSVGKTMMDAGKSVAKTTSSIAGSVAKTTKKLVKQTGEALGMTKKAPRKSNKATAAKPTTAKATKGKSAAQSMKKKGK